MFRRRSGLFANALVALSLSAQGLAIAPIPDARGIEHQAPVLASACEGIIYDFDGSSQAAGARSSRPAVRMFLPGRIVYRLVSTWIMLILPSSTSWISLKVLRGVRAPGLPKTR
jgi:hypothetical protein